VKLGALTSWRASVVPLHAILSSVRSGPPRAPRRAAHMERASSPADEPRILGVARRASQSTRVNCEYAGIVRGPRGRTNLAAQTSRAARWRRPGWTRVAFAEHTATPREPARRVQRRRPPTITPDGSRLRPQPPEELPHVPHQRPGFFHRCEVASRREARP